MNLETFINTPGLIFDVRSPGEFFQGRIPTALNLPLFSDNERSQIGTLYKQVSRQSAIEKGLEIVVPKVSELIDFVVSAVPKGSVKIHCWRGGMRSASVALMLNSVGLTTCTLQGGYKSFRKWALKTLTTPYQLHILGGMTGSGKTAILQELKNLGEQVLDLESLAGHRGSTFGNLGLSLQPTNEQFENEIAMQWHSFDPSKPVWIEDESRTIGSCKIPDNIFNAMKNSPFFLIERPLDERLEQIKNDYWQHSLQDLISCAQRLSKKLGGLRTKELITYIEQSAFKEATVLLLEYYDTTYNHEMKRREPAINRLTGEKLSNYAWAKKLIYSKELNRRNFGCAESLGDKLIKCPVLYTTGPFN
ncbi:MAG: tRNA 2-selenouridine(34) synthase MnmH [Parachlamydiaceae bacterium]|nr:tRNA 2-selenouridine(34) synthase MnmH [Parachlamydiaceae bacterium]